MDISPNTYYTNASNDQHCKYDNKNISNNIWNHLKRWTIIYLFDRRWWCDHTNYCTIIIVTVDIDDDEDNYYYEDDGGNRIIVHYVLIIITTTTITMTTRTTMKKLTMMMITIQFWSKGIHLVYHLKAFNTPSTFILLNTILTIKLQIMTIIAIIGDDDQY